MWPGCMHSSRQDRLNSIEHVVGNQRIEVSTLSDDAIASAPTMPTYSLFCSIVLNALGMRSSRRQVDDDLHNTDVALSSPGPIQGPHLRHPLLPELLCDVAIDRVAEVSALLFPLAKVRLQSLAAARIERAPDLSGAHPCTARPPS